MKYFLALLVLAGVLACSKAPLLKDGKYRITGKEEVREFPGQYVYTVSGYLNTGGGNTVSEFEIESVRDWNVGDTLSLDLINELSKKHSFSIGEYLDMSEKTQDTIFVKFLKTPNGDSVIVKFSIKAKDTVR